MPSTPWSRSICATRSDGERFLDNRTDGERFLDTIRRIGHGPFKEKIYAAD